MLLLLLFEDFHNMYSLRCELEINNNTTYSLHDSASNFGKSIGHPSLAILGCFVSNVVTLKINKAGKNVYIQMALNDLNL